VLKILILFILTFPLSIRQKASSEAFVSRPTDTNNDSTTNEKKLFGNGERVKGINTIDFNNKIPWRLTPYRFPVWEKNIQGLQFLF
jgi:hypothetical protein